MHMRFASLFPPYSDFLSGSVSKRASRETDITHTHNEAASGISFQRDNDDDHALNGSLEDPFSNLSSSKES